VKFPGSTRRVKFPGPTRPGPVSQFDERAGWPSPGAAIWQYGGSPWIWAADGVQDTIAYKFAPATGFSEIFRFHDNAPRLSSPPTALDNVVAAVGTTYGVRYERVNWQPAAIGSVTAAPTLLPNGLLAAVNRTGGLSILYGPTVVMSDQLNGQSITSAASSCSHLFVAAENEFVSYDLNTLRPVTRLAWTGGGLHAPIISPDGHVYAITDRGLFTFFPPARPPLTFLGTQCAPRPPTLSGRGLPAGAAPSAPGSPLR
jgi:hypothetical protein